MAQLMFIGPSGQDVYAVLINASGSWWNDGAVLFEAYNESHFTIYALDLAEVGSTGCYSASLPAIPSGSTVAVYRRRLGSFPMDTDVNIGAETFFSGTTELNQVAEGVEDLLTQVVGVAT